ncbi:hypothetical protein AU193_10435 [Mycobacterium sp. GA-1285]|uniref:lipoprotein LpqH n=1 Tax=Mycobacterium sp. GA-1285 TaxID=1772282 RepID=UPI000747AA44|nr:lipoprotein LpqH [Mycobacterium sp. GA-1285]KUI22714.1 hypothetical protein AU193_10435 [Mycobacterium sp. GA-1285]
MRFRPSALAVAAAAVVSGCGLTGSTPTEPSAQSGEVTVDGTTVETQSVECTRQEWTLLIDASAKPGRAEVFLELGGAQPIVRTVNIQNINDLNGVAGGDNGKAEATNDGSIYTISGTVVGSDPGNPGQSRTMPFEIKAPC